MNQDSNGVHVGLVKQEYSPYLNSLLQTFLMTPEFRNGLYKWEYKGKKAEEAESIPYQLQKLFVSIQTSGDVKSALMTEELTKSFGWDDIAWVEADERQIRGRILEALIESWANTDQANVITSLYQGSINNYVKCLQCSRENFIELPFFDLCLSLHQAGTNAAYNSVEEALRGFLQPSVIDEQCQYQCQHCDKKVNVKKGMKIKKFPYFLTLQLKRFDIDAGSLDTLELSNRVTFPELLDMNAYSHSQSQSPYTYELFSVMVLAHSADGDEVYAYIRNLDTKVWHCFKDEMVTVASAIDIRSTFGGVPSSSNGSSAIAYVLSYRQIDPERNQKLPLTVPARLLIKGDVKS